MQPIQAFYPQLYSPAKVVITMHQKPDGDAMGAALGLYHFLKKIGHSAVVISPTNWAKFLNWLPGAEAVLNFEQETSKSNAFIQAADVIYCLDFNTLHRTKNMEQQLAKAKGLKILIDHHQHPQVDVFAYGVSNTHKSSTCEMVYDLICESGNASKIDLDIANCLYTGIMTDTGNFRFPSTSAAVHQAVAYFKQLGLDNQAVYEKIYNNFSELRLRFIGFALSQRMEVLYDYNAALMYIYKQDLIDYDIKTGDTEGLVDYLLTIEGIRFGAIVVDRNEERRWSFRSKGNFDVNSFARKYFEGGGHFNAAGGRSIESVDETIDRFKKIIPNYQSQLQ